MLILHNREDKASRDFVATYGNQPGVTVLDWYDEAARQQWLDAGGTLAISAFPSVLLRHDTYTVETDGGEQTVEAGWDVLRLPESIDPLPAVGEPVAVGLYTYDGAYLICRQAHTRTIYEPHETPALFSVWRPDSEDMIWIANEPVGVGDERIYNGVRYRAIQAHTTQVDWRPDLTPALWEVVEDEPGEPSGPQPWVQPQGAHNAYQIGDRVTHNGQLWESTLNANVWEPGVAGWIVVS